MRTSKVSPLLVMLLVAGCEGTQRMLDTRGPAAERIAELWWVMFVLATAVSVIVSALLLYAIRVARGRGAGTAAGEVNGRVLVWGGGVIVPAIILIGVLVYSFRVAADVYPSHGAAVDGTTIEVVGHTFWWEVNYPAEGVTTANEIKIPAGEPVQLRLSSPDVIHSFWVPQLHGKMDMIPGRIHTLVIQADEPGIFRGQCAEFCGLGHALMAFELEALPREEFRAWLEAGRTAGETPGPPETRAGREVFFAAGCNECHATQGAPLPASFGSVGPDLSNVGSRRMLAAGLLPNTPEALRAWIEHPQRLKPGARMPATRLRRPEMDALLGYLGSLR